ncbi:glycerol-3-phosphate dehydrogenase/oxidase [Bacillus piscicola]|uniref:glycerol-3-phosphate dehydrogenase/oxidase n=1 Tax=Bacillus piscicola TaxID=1632684 RepID=UPI001F08B537|nr:glycerol-3-phosphate dehydrogenase/oxidase [Bacillus piscicola]
MRFSSLQRDEWLEKMEKTAYDLLVIGGGITGAGIALDAASRGMKVALVEMQDFAAGTSSRSTKLIHGGLRYLKNGELRLVAEVGKERAVVYENGPHVTTPTGMLLPIYRGGSLGKYSTAIGLRLYDFLAGVKKGERRNMLSRAEVVKKEPLLKQEGLVGGGYYVEYRTDDARLTLEVLKQAVNYGADAVNYTKVDGFVYEKEKVAGVTAIDQQNGKKRTIHARKIVNAAGPWVDTLREKDDSKLGKFLTLTKGVHLVFDQSVFPLKQAIYFDNADGRMLFAIPREGKTYVGTTDTTYTSDLARPRVTEEDRDYLLRAVRSMFPSLSLTAEEVEASWAGLRPLIMEEDKSPSEISRKDEIWESPSGLITIAGGKLTGYRKMAETIVDLVAKKFKEERYKLFSPSMTASLPISGGDVGGAVHFESFIQRKGNDGSKLGLSRENAETLARRYGSNVDDVFAILEELRKRGGESESERLIDAQLQYAIEHEMAVTPLDFFIRRTGAMYLKKNWVLTHKERVLEWMSETLQWSEAEKQAHRRELEDYLKSMSVPW